VRASAALWGFTQATTHAPRIGQPATIRIDAYRDVVLHGRVYSPPFVVSAIGDPERLRTALDEEPGVEYFRTYVDRYDLGYSVRTVDLDLPAYDGPLELPHVTRAK